MHWNKPDRLIKSHRKQLLQVPAAEGGSTSCCITGRLRLFSHINKNMMIKVTCWCSDGCFCWMLRYSMVRWVLLFYTGEAFNSYMTLHHSTGALKQCEGDGCVQGRHVKAASFNIRCQKTKWTWCSDPVNCVWNVERLEKLCFSRHSSTVNCHRGFDLKSVFYYLKWCKETLLVSSDLEHLSLGNKQ